MPDVAANAQIQKQARVISEIVGSEGWKIFVTVLQEQIALREKLLGQPLHDLPNPNRLDFVALAASQEAIKGTIIGLKLALDLPRVMIEHSRDISRQAENREEKKQ